MTMHEELPTPTVRVVEAPRAMSYAARWRSGQQLVAAQLALMRHRGGVDAGQHTAERDLAESGILAGRAEIESDSIYAARVTVSHPDSETTRTRYDIDVQAGTLSVQSITADGVALGDPIRYGADEVGDAALSHLRLVLFAANTVAG